MILADTSVWIDHFRAHDEKLAALLDKGRILAHPFFIGELALGHLRRAGDRLSGRPPPRRRAPDAGREALDA